MIKNYNYKLKARFAYDKCRVDRSLEELLLVSPEGVKGVHLPQLNGKAIPKKCSSVTETIFHKIFTG